MKSMVNELETWLLNFFYKTELKRRKKVSDKNILPNYVLNRHIKIITNGKVIFDSQEFEKGKIPIAIQYAIKQYGYPSIIKFNNKTPLIYNITSKNTSLFSTVEEQNLCMKNLK